MQNQTSNGVSSPPNFRRVWTATLIVLVSFFLLRLVFKGSNEPNYGGKTLTQWLLNTNASWVWIPNDVYGHIHDELWFKLVESMKTSNTVSIDTWRERGEFTG